MKKIFVIGAGNNPLSNANSIELKVLLADHYSCSPEEIELVIDPRRLHEFKDEAPDITKELDIALTPKKLIDPIPFMDKKQKSYSKHQKRHAHRSKWR